MKFEDLYEGPRFEKRAKHRKLNKLLNISIILIFLLILFFTYQLFFGNKNEQAMINTGSKSSNQSDQSVIGDKENTEEANSGEDESEKQEQSSTVDSNDSSSASSENSTSGNEVITETSDDPNVLTIISNNTWEPIGTEQEEPHVAVYDSQSQDWKEMLMALEYATGLSKDEWILWRLGNGGSGQHAIGVVSSKNTDDVYRVYLEWVQNEGWVPTKMEELASVEEFRSNSNNTETNVSEDASASEENSDQ